MNTIVIINRGCQILAVSALILLLGACAGARYQRKAEVAYNRARFESQFSGILVVDPLRQDTLITLNSKRYFTPASITKIFTLFAGLNYLPDQLPALIYSTQGDTLYIKGTGYPALKHPSLRDTTTLKFLENYSTISVFLENFNEPVWGSGWAWDDFDQYYTVEKSPLPLYANVVQVIQQPDFIVEPEYFRDSIKRSEWIYKRVPDKNLFYVRENDPDTLQIPFIGSNETTTRLLTTELNRPVTLSSHFPDSPDTDIIYGIPADTLYREMMLKSDNFLAEQILILVSSQMGDTLSTQKAIDNVVKKDLSELRQLPRWVDGSGLSRYNLFTPESVVDVLNRLYRSLPEARLFNLFPAGGVNGTLEDWYSGDPEPYVFAKTGSLGNTHNLSGYLKTRSGKILIFSIMNNHFRISTPEVKAQMQELLEFLRDRY